MDDLKRFLRVSRREPLYSVGWITGGFLAGLALVLIINAALNEEEDFAPIGMLLAVVMAATSTLVGGNRTGATRLALAVSMGQTRRSFLVFDSLFHLLWFLLGLALCRFYAWVEQALYRAIYPGYVNAMPLERLFDPAVVALLCAAVVGFNLLFTMLLTRFGPNVFSVWLIPWLLFLFLSRAEALANQGAAGPMAAFGHCLIALFELLSPQGLLALGLGAALVMSAAGVLGLRRAEIAI